MDDERGAERSAAASRPAAFAPVMLVAVLGGGIVGTLARVGIGDLFQLGADPALRAIGDAAGHFTDPALQATLVANLLGSLVLGLVNGAHFPGRLAWLQAAIGPGFCGAFTTFSYVALALAASGLATAWGWGLLVIGLLGGLLLAWIGMVIGSAIAPGAASRGITDPESEEDS